MSNYRVERWKESHAPAAATLESQMKCEGYSVFQWSDRPQVTYALHKHERDQSHWIISGVLELTIEKVGTFVLRAGDRDFMPAGTYHSARVVSEEPVVYLIGEKI
jgi:quercetin dioxygenase-like cupin family protein